ncbi:MAG TPA: toll/interleukin-1 receptor domain-containing protein [Solirubrobacteraceae bacterium]|nr:toll/interleukin-1 receptor domain-containing protein [Solirubrobacteraceae bacterium]
MSLEALDAAPDRASALRVGRDLAALAARDALVEGDGAGYDEVARLLSELEFDGWLAWDWSGYGGDPRPDQPPPSMFDYQALQRVQNVRITPDGYAAYVARQRLGGDTRGAPGANPIEPSGGGEHTYDIFICHASDDKETVARPLALALQSLGFSVWFDEQQMEVGASLRTTIETGLASSRYGVVVLSHAFFSKQWPQHELNGLFARETAHGDEVILTLWHDIDADFLLSKAPMMADRFALNMADGVDDVATRLARRLRREQAQDQLRSRAPLPPNHPQGSASEPTPSTALPSHEVSGLDVRERVIELLSAGDEVGLRELLRLERRAFEDSTLVTLKEAADTLGSSADPKTLQPVERALWAHVDRRLGSLLPLVDYKPATLSEDLSSLSALAGRPTPTRSPYTAWLDGPRWPVWLVTLILGSTAVAFERFEVLLAMWSQHASYDEERPLPVARLGGAADLGEALLRARSAHVTRAIELWYPAFAVADSPLLATHYREILRAGDATDSALGFLSRAGDFLWLCGALAGRDMIDVIRFWSAPQVHPTLRTRLAQDTQLAEHLAAALDVASSELLPTLDTWISRAPSRGF